MPKFYPKLNWGLWDTHRKTLIATLCGHKLGTTTETFFSVEVLATHPQHQRQGHAWNLIQHSLKHLPKNSPLLFYTRCPKAKKWYEKHGLKIVREQKLYQLSLENQEFHGISINDDLSSNDTNLWCFAISSQ
jgi:ribosomal protein S18 acetylase RimI-like enzyme